MILHINVTLNDSSRPVWRLDPTLLSDSNVCQFISKAINDFLLINQDDTKSPSILWESLKVVFRGQIISFTASHNKDRRRAQEDLISSISKIDHQYSTLQLYKDKLNLKSWYDLWSTEKTEYNLLRSSAFFYEHGELALQLQGRSASPLLANIRNGSGPPQEY